MTSTRVRRCSSPKGRSRVNLDNSHFFFGRFSFDSFPGRVAPLAVITSTFDEISSSGDVHFIYDDDKMAVNSVMVVVTINGNTAFSDSLSVGTFSYSFGTSTLNQIKNSSNNAIVSVCVSDDDSNSDCGSVQAGGSGKWEKRAEMTRHDACVASPTYLTMSMCSVLSNHVDHRLVASCLSIPITSAPSPSIASSSIASATNVRLGVGV